MRSFFFCLLLLLAWPLSEVAAQRPREPTSEEEIVAALRSTDIPTIFLGVSGVISIGPPEEWSPTLRSAILYALESEMRRDAEAARAGVYRFAEAGFTDENLQGPLTDLAAVMQDPAAIPLLVLSTDPTERAALIDFGRQALPDLLRVAREGDYLRVPREGDFFALKGALIVLRQMVQARGLGYFTAQERAQMKSVAALYVSPGTPNSYKKVYAAQLLLVLEDAEGRGWVEAAAPGDKQLQDLLDGAPMLPLLGKPLSWHLARHREVYGHNWDQ